MKADGLCRTCERCGYVGRYAIGKSDMDLRKMPHSVDIDVANAGTERTSVENNTAPKTSASRSDSHLDNHIVSFFVLVGHRQAILKR